VTAEAEQGEGDQGIGGLEPERDSGDQAGLGVGRLDQAVGQVVLDRGEEGSPNLEACSGRTQGVALGGCLCHAQ